MITNDTRIAWALARDGGLRSQYEVTQMLIELGCKVDTSVKGGAGAAAHADYAKVHTCIESMPMSVKAVGDALNCRGIISDTALNRASSLAALSAAQMVSRKMPGYPRWKPAKQQMLYYVALAALERSWVILHDIPEALDCKGRQEGRTLNEPWKVQKWIRGKLNQLVDAKNWSQDWGKVWPALIDAIFELDEMGQVRIEELIGEVRNWQKAS